MQIVANGSTDLPELSIEAQSQECQPAAISAELWDLKKVYFEFLNLTLEAERTKVPFYTH